MKTPKIINAINFVEDDLISAANEQKAKKPFYITTTFKRATAIAACLAIVAVTAFTLTKKPDNNITSDNNSGTSSQNKKVIYVTGDTADNYDNLDDGILSLEGRYISPKLQEKMDLYKDYTDAQVVFRVVVQSFSVAEDWDAGEKLADADKEVQLLFEQREAAYLEEQKAYAEYQAFCETNPGNEPEIIAECSRLVAIYEAKEDIRKEISSKWGDLKREKVYEYVKKRSMERFEFLSQFGKKELVSASTGGYYMDLTAEEINILAEKGGYMFKLSSNDYIPGEYDE